MKFGLHDADKENCRNRRKAFENYALMKISSITNRTVMLWNGGARTEPTTWFTPVRYSVLLPKIPICRQTQLKAVQGTSHGNSIYFLKEI